jgi:hypothetical protein
MDIQLNHLRCDTYPCLYAAVGHGYGVAFSHYIHSNRVLENNFEINVAKSLYIGYPIKYHYLGEK